MTQKLGRVFALSPVTVNARLSGVTIPKFLSLKFITRRRVQVSSVAELFCLLFTPLPENSIFPPEVPVFLFVLPYVFFFLSNDKSRASQRMLHEIDKGPLNLALEPTG